MSFIEIEQSIEIEGWSMPDLHSHPHYEFYFLESGERSFFVGNTLYSVKANTVVLVPPYVMHKTEGGAFSRINVDFSDDIFDEQEREVLQELCKITVYPLKRENGQAVRNLLLAMLAVSNNVGKLNRTAVTMCVKSLIGCLYLFRSAVEDVEKVSANGSIKPLTLNIIRYINENCHEKLSIETLATKFNLSKSCLSKTFKSETGYNVGEYILNARINEAKHMLQSAKLSVNEIAEALGFSSANYFGLIFKQKVGVSPLAYKRWLNT